MESEILQQILSELKDLKAGQSKLEKGQKQIRKDIADVKLDIKLLWQETNIVEKRITKHEREFHAVG